MRQIITALVLSSLLAACGARGPLEPPQNAPQQAPDNPIILDKVL